MPASAQGEGTGTDHVPVPSLALRAASWRAAATVFFAARTEPSGAIDLLVALTDYPREAFVTHTPSRLRVMLVAATIEQQEGRDPRGIFTEAE